MKNIIKSSIPFFFILISMFSCQEDENSHDTDRLFTKKSRTETTTKQTSTKQTKHIPENSYATIDKHARNSPKSVEVDVPTLANYLIQKANTDLEKSRAIYVWIAENVEYDDKAFNSGKYGDYSVNGVLKHRKAVCEGYSNLYKALGQEMGLEVKKVVGYSKGYGYVVGSKFDKSDHAWNAMKIDGKWRVFDATWGRGSGKNVRGKLVSTKAFNDYWFNVDPYEAIFSHMPEDNKFAFVEPNLSLNDYEQMPSVSSEYFKMGFGGKEIYTQAYHDPKTEFPDCYTVNTYIKVISAPSYKTLKQNESYDFEFFVPDGKSMTVIDAKNDLTHFKEKNGIFKLNYRTQEKGELKISVQLDRSKKTYHGMLTYRVGKGKDAI